MVFGKLKLDVGVYGKNEWKNITFSLNLTTDNYYANKVVMQ